MVHDLPVTLQTDDAIEMLAELVNDPNRPNTNPAMAIAAMRVMAMRMTVARTGEMAFLFCLRIFSKFIVGPFLARSLIKGYGVSV